MKLLIISDSHGRSGKVKKMIDAHKDVNGIIFLGDGEKDMELAMAVKTLFWGDEPAPFVYQVRGNCDRDSMEEATLVKEIGGIRFYITHGHEQGVKYNLEKLVNYAKEENCTVALFGHTHGERLLEIDGVKLFNPGCAANGSYGIIQIEDGNIKFRHAVIG